MDTQKIGRFIAENRKKQHMTQVQLAQRLNVTNKTVSRWENGNYMPDLSLLQPLSEQLGVTLNELLRGEYISSRKLPFVAEQNIQNTIDYSKKKIKKSNRFVIAVITVCMAVMLVMGYYFTQQNYIRYGMYDSIEQCRKEVLKTLDFTHGVDSVYWREETFKGRWYQVCMFITDEKSGVFLIEKINGKYSVADATIVTQALKPEDDDYIPLHVIYGYGHPKPFDEAYIHWDAVPYSNNVEIRFKDTIIEKMATVNGYTLWYRITDYWPDYAEITVTQKEN